MKNIGFIGVGYMGYGIAKNILKHKNKLFVIANKNRKILNAINTTLFTVACHFGSLFKKGVSIVYNFLRVN